MASTSLTLRNNWLISIRVFIYWHGRSFFCTSHVARGDNALRWCASSLCCKQTYSRAGFLYCSSNQKNTSRAAAQCYRLYFICGASEQTCGPNFLMTRTLSFLFLIYTHPRRRSECAKRYQGIQSSIWAISAPLTKRPSNLNTAPPQPPWLIPTGNSYSFTPHTAQGESILRVFWASGWGSC